MSSKIDKTMCFIFKTQSFELHLKDLYSFIEIPFTQNTGALIKHCK